MTGKKSSADPTKTEVECSKTKKQSSSHSRRSSSHHEKSASAKKSVTVGAPSAANSNRQGKRAPDWCYPSRKADHQQCDLDFQWQRNKYVRDECGSGILTAGACPNKRIVWCNTPLSMYQATIGEMGRKILCGETKLHKDLFPEPPCNIAEDILRPCRGYYRKYDCIRECEEGLAVQKEGKKVYRSVIERYWNPCEMYKDSADDIRENAAHNAYLSRLMRRRDNDCNQQPCW